MKKYLYLKVAILETTITEKKRQVDKLVVDMKEANLQSLAISPPDELKFILEGIPLNLILPYILILYLFFNKI